MTTASPVVPATTQAPAPVAAATPQPGSPEYDAAMAAKFDAAQPSATPVPSPAPVADARPDGLPEKFKSVADLIKAHAELEKKLGSATPAPATVPAPAPVTPDASKLAITPADPSAPADPATDPAKAAVTDAGLDFDALTTEFTEKGALAPETYEKLNAKGIPKATVDAYIAGQQALATQAAAAYDNAAFTQAGGEEAFKAMTSWAASGLTGAEAEAYNAAVTSGDTDKMRLAVSDLKAKYQASVGTAPTLVRATGPAADGIYASAAEMTADMRDPRYAKDPAFRAKVAAKLDKSPLFHITERG